MVEGPRGFGTASGEVNNEASKIESHDSEPGTCNGWITWYHQDCGTYTKTPRNKYSYNFTCNFCDSTTFEKFILMMHTHQ